MERGVFEILLIQWWEKEKVLWYLQAPVWSWGSSPYSPADVKLKLLVCFPRQFLGALDTYILQSKWAPIRPMVLCSHPSCLQAAPASPLTTLCSLCPRPGRTSSPLLLLCPSQATKFSHNVFSLYPHLTFSNFFCMFYLYLIVSHLSQSISFLITPQHFTLLYFLYSTHTLTYRVCVCTDVLWDFLFC